MISLKASWGRGYLMVWNESFGMRSESGVGNGYSPQPGGTEWVGPDDAAGTTFTRRLCNAR